MAWRPTQYLIEGELDNTQRGKVTGWMRYAGLDGRVAFELDGEFHRDIRGAKIHFRGGGNACTDTRDAAASMDHFALHQTGQVGDITAGLAPRDYVSYPYIEWFSDQNGRVVLELEPEQLEVIGTPIPACESDPISGHQKTRNLMEFLYGLRESLGTGTDENGGTTKSTDDSGGQDDMNPLNSGEGK